MVREKSNDSRKTDDSVKIGLRIKKARIESVFSQEQLAEKTGISKTQISNYENGVMIGLPNLAQIALNTNTSLDELYFGRAEERPITTASNKGELIVNCLVALMDAGAIKLIPIKKNKKGYSDCDKYMPKVDFTIEYRSILEDLMRKLGDFEADRENYPDPEIIKLGLISAAAKKINSLNDKTN